MYGSLGKTNFFLFLLVVCISKVEVCQQSCITDVRKVSTCPTTRQEWIRFSRLKNCSSRSNACSLTVPLKYHCLLNAFRNETNDMCATDADIIGFSCAEYNKGGACIQPNFNNKCNGPKFYPKCPFKYPSSDIYLYPGCFVFREQAVEKGNKTENSTFPNENPADELPGVEFIIPPILILMICLMVFIVYRCVKDRSSTIREEVTKEQVPMYPCDINSNAYQGQSLDSTKSSI